MKMLLVIVRLLDNISTRIHNKIVFIKLKKDISRLNDKMCGEGSESVKSDRIA